ncbi:hypothetical protein [Kocuria rosea]|uniref:hypothetical protein n=1 Tax=Kocuria rosea TaxID=1275 RepID=UPI00253F8217|nr:hypothetical protein [Kocuria rosea]WIG19301.1 hypothetical protein QOY29_17910 [Kocuria rosea]
MSTTYTPVTCAPVEVTTAARAAGLRPGFGVVMAADAHDRARALTERSDLEEGVAVVMGALSATLEALIGNRRELSVGTTWTVRTGYLGRARWTVLVAADGTDSTDVVLYINPT